MAKTKTSVSDAAKSNGVTTRAKAADSPKAKSQQSPKSKSAVVAPKAQQQQQKGKPAAASPKAKAKPVAASPKPANGVVKKAQQPQQQQQKGGKASTKGGAQQNNKNNSKKQQQQQQVPKGPNYFEVPSYAILDFLLIAVGFGLLAGAVFAPNTIPWFLGPVATFAKQLSASYNAVLKIVLFVGLGLHVVEGLVAVYLCRQKRINLVPTLKWWAQTTILGFFSLRLLLKHANAGGKKKK